ncbi:MAG: MarR family winged helix-turn-helix transcriptional regulator [Planctomycetes bacterium]|nr:MarR family winged helix-turn-helix transcriptional regulator [Planctomycetota bacterium]
MLAVLLENDGSSLREVAEVLRIRPPSVTELVDKLERAGLIERRQSATDQRVVHIHLTDEGKREAEHAHSSGREGMDQLFIGLSEEEVSQLSSLLDRVLKNCDHLAGEKPHHFHHHDHGEDGDHPHGRKSGHRHHPAHGRRRPHGGCSHCSCAGSATESSEEHGADGQEPVS